MKSLLFVFAAVSITACATEPDERQFVIKVDSVRSPTAVSGGAPFDAEFFGRIGGGCSQLKEYRLIKSNAAADITFIGVDASRGVTCGDAVRMLDMKVTISPPITDPFEMRVHQPNREILSRIIRAE
jgi:hypothetical protein